MAAQNPRFWRKENITIFILIMTIVFFRGTKQETKNLTIIEINSTSSNLIILSTFLKEKSNSTNLITKDISSVKKPTTKSIQNLNITLKQISSKKENSSSTKVYKTSEMTQPITKSTVIKKTPEETTKTTQYKKLFTTIKNTSNREATTDISTIMLTQKRKTQTRAEKGTKQTTTLTTQGANKKETSTSMSNTIKEKNQTTSTNMEKSKETTETIVIVVEKKKLPFGIILAIVFSTCILATAGFCVIKQQRKNGYRRFNNMDMEFEEISYTFDRSGKSLKNKKF